MQSRNYCFLLANIYIFQLISILEDLAATLTVDQDVVFFKMSVTEFDFLEDKKFPALYLYHKTNRLSPILYEGEFNEYKIYTWIQERLKGDYAQQIQA